MSSRSVSWYVHVLAGAFACLLIAITACRNPLTQTTDTTGTEDAAISNMVSAPTFDPTPASYYAAQNVVLTTSTPEAEIRYTTDGSDPDESSALYADPIPISMPTTIKARAYKAGMDPSRIVSGAYTIGTSALPVNSYAFTSGQVETRDPSYVSILFNVKKVGSPDAVSSLTETDFNVLEDGYPVSSVESPWKVRRIEDTIPYTIRTVLMLDTSTSIGSDLDYLKAAAKELVAQMVPNQVVAVYKFSDRPELVLDFTDSQSALASSIDSISLGYASTDLYNSIVTGLGQWTDDYSIDGVTAGILVVFTDGRDTTGTLTEEDVVTARGSKSIVCLGAGNELDRAELDRIGTVPSYTTDDYSELLGLFQRTQSAITNWMNSFYWLYFHSPKRGDSTHTLEVTLKNNTNPESDSEIVGEFNSRDFYSIMGGLYVNDNQATPSGVTSVKVAPSSSVDLVLHTYLGANDPQYQFTFDSALSSGISTQTIASSPIETTVRLTMGSVSGSGHTFTISDTANSLTKGLTFGGLPDSATITAAGDNHTLTRTSAGSVWSWGLNADGQLGIGSTSDSHVPVEVTGMDNVVAIAGGASHTVAVRSDRTVWTWGKNDYGQLGDGTYIRRDTPVTALGMTDTVLCAAGSEHSMAVKSDGTVWSWGRNSVGQLGDGSTSSRTTPVQVGGLSGVSAVAAGTSHSLALRSDGTVWAWGLNTYGQLGDGSTTQRLSPVQVSGLTEVIAVAAGANHSVALKSDGTVWAWGLNTYGQLGDGSTTQRLTPVQVSGLSGIDAIAAGGDHTLALQMNSSPWAWGLNTYGQLGNGSTSSSSSPVQVSGLALVVAIGGGRYHSSAIRSDGTTWTWGYNGYGQLGDGSTTNRTLPGRAW